ncbi:SGNH hydrolase [Spirilliplanes yamanashiensis]|uniref:SGNH hydrolase n=1 Tax=Spirilliplanes yamanashiensis TaxID=42233 RepID=A0A8J3Y8M4_9ACTN|nr:SGNH hydrolase [Spirilliplanes yamanashiensis]
MTTGVTLTLAVLGDSIAYGQGASRPADTVGARLAARLRAAGTDVDVHVVAVPGARSQGLAAQVQRAAPARPDVALIIIGANDVTHLVPPQQAAAHLGDAVRALRAAGAEVVVAPAPDLSVVPWVPPQMRAAVRAGCAAFQQAQIRAAAAAGARVADPAGGSATGFAVDPGLFSADRFHPSSAGYAVITDAVAPAVEAAVEAVTARRAGTRPSS